MDDFDDLQLSDLEDLEDDDLDDDADAGRDADERDADEQPAAAATAGATEEGPTKKRQKKTAKPVFGVHKSKQQANAKDPERNAAQRAAEYTKRVKAALDLRADIKIDVLNRLVLSLSSLERAQLRAMGAMQQEHYVAQRSAVDKLQTHCYNALNGVDLRACEALPVRLMQRMADRLSTDEDGKRVVLCKPPDYKGKYNPVTRKSNREQGIKSEGKAVMAPRIFPRHGAIVAAGRRVIDGRTLHLATDFDGAA
jgi:hypothetical protein